MMLKGPRTPPIICTIDLSGFVVVMAMVVFTLMVAIMSWPHPHIGVSVNMPKAHFPVSMLRENREDAMVIMITRDGKVYFDLNSVTPDMLPALIREGLVGGAERKVYLKVDAMAKYRLVLLVLARVRSAGVEKVAFMVGQRPNA